MSATGILNEACEIAPHDPSNRFGVKAVHPTDGVLDWEDVAWLVWLGSGAIPIGVISFSNQTVELDVAEDAGLAQHRGIHREVAPQLDGARRRGRAAKPPVQHRPVHRPLGQLIEEFVGRTITVQTGDPRLIDQEVEDSTKRLQLLLSGDLGAAVEADLAHERGLPDEGAEASRIETVVAPHHARMTTDPPDDQFVLALESSARLGKRACGREDHSAQALQIVRRSRNVDVGMQI
jgi:hypothetical protein